MENTFSNQEEDMQNTDADGGSSKLRKITASSDAVCTVDVRPRVKFDPERRAQLASLYKQIEEDIVRERELRLEIDERVRLGKEIRQVSSSVSGRPVSELDPSMELDRVRERLREMLELRIALLQLEISWIDDSLGHHRVNSLKDEGREELLRQLDMRNAELSDHKARFAGLDRWYTRQRIEGVRREISEVDAQINSQTTTSPDKNAIKRKAELEAKLKQLAESLTTTTPRYAQGGKAPWGKHIYGIGTSCTTIGAGGCGPTSLAMVLNYLAMEDPEAAESGGSFVGSDPGQVAAWAATHGRVCPVRGNPKTGGTSGDIMFRDVPSQWPGLRTRKIPFAQVESELNVGNLVVFLGKKYTVKNVRGATHGSDGHFMVLTGVASSGKEFRILDSSKFEGVTIERTNLQAHSAGYWVVTREPW